MRIKYRTGSFLSFAPLSSPSHPTPDLSPSCNHRTRICRIGFSQIQMMCLGVTEAVWWILQKHGMKKVRKWTCQLLRRQLLPVSRSHALLIRFAWHPFNPPHTAFFMPSDIWSENSKVNDNSRQSGALIFEVSTWQTRHHQTGEGCHTLCGFQVT